MASFALVFFYNAYDVASNYYVMQDDMTTVYTGSNCSNAFFAADRTNNCFFVCESNVVTKRSLSDGSLIATEFESVGQQKCLFVDGTFNLWTIDSTDNKTVRKWAADLSSRTDYELKTGNVLDDKIRFIAITYDMDYMYLLGGDNNDYLAKYDIDNLDGGDPEWSTDTNQASHFLLVDSDDNVFVLSLAAIGGKVLKYDSSGNVQWNTIYGHGYSAVINDKFFTIATDPDGVTAGAVKQLDTDGSYVGKTETVVNPLTRSVHVYHSNMYVGHYESEFGGANSAIYEFNIASNLSDGDANTGSLQIAAEKNHLAYGDAAGWLSEVLRLKYLEDTKIANVQDLLDELALRLEDTEQKRFPEKIKFEAYNRAQTRIANYLRYEYAQDLLKIETGIDISSGEYALSSLTDSVLNEEEGILGVLVTIDSTEYWAYEISVNDLKRFENNYFDPAEGVYYYIYNDKLNVRVSSDLSLSGATADVYMLKIPDDMTLWVDTELDESLFPVLVTMAEYYCWEIENRQDKAKTIRDLTKMEIDVLNYKFTASSDVVIGG